MGILQSFGWQILIINIRGKHYEEKIFHLGSRVALCQDLHTRAHWATSGVLRYLHCNLYLMLVGELHNARVFIKVFDSPEYWKENVKLKPDVQIRFSLASLKQSCDAFKPWRRTENIAGHLQLFLGGRHDLL